MDKQTNVKKVDKDDVVQDDVIQDDVIQDDVIQRTAWQDQNSEYDLDMKQTLKPVLFGMVVAGCYNVIDIQQTKHPLVKISSLKYAASTIYRFIYFVAIFLFFCKAVVACFYVSSEFLSFHLQFVFWLLFNLATYIIILKATSRKYGHLEKVFNSWTEEIMPYFMQLQIQYPRTKIKRRGIIAVTACITAVFFNIIGGIVLVYTTNPDIFVSPFESNPLTLIVAFVFYAASTFIWAMSVAAVIIFSMFIKEAFNSTNQYVTAICNKAHREQCDNFNKVRLLHLNLCKILGDLDQDLSWYYAANFMFNVGSSTFILYQIIRISMDTFQLTLFGIWLVAGIVNVTLPTVHAALLHDAAHAPLDSIYYINVQDITVEKLAQLNLFLSKLTGTQVGFSTCGLLIITKEFILTIAGVFLTYFAVLYTL